MLAKRVSNPAIAVFIIDGAGSRDAAKMFRGKDCGLCKESAWVVKSKGIR